MRILPVIFTSIPVLVASIGASYAADSNSMKVNITNDIRNGGETYSSSLVPSESWCGSGQYCNAPSYISYGGYGTATNYGTGYDRRMIYTYKANDYGPLPRVCRINVVMEEDSYSSGCKGGQGFTAGFCTGSIDITESTCSAKGSVTLKY